MRPPVFFRRFFRMEVYCYIMLFKTPFSTFYSILSIDRKTQANSVCANFLLQSLLINVFDCLDFTPPTTTTTATKSTTTPTTTTTTPTTTPTTTTLDPKRISSGNTDKVICYQINLKSGI